MKIKKRIKSLRSVLIRTLCSFLYNNDLRQSAKVNGWCKFNGKETFGRNANFNGCKVYGKGVVNFGDNFHSAKGLKILTSFHNYNGNKLPYDDTLITKNVVFEDNVWIGMDVIVLGGVTIGEGSIVQAGSVVVKSIPKYSICGGSPAVSFSSRNVAHYEALKKAGKFL